MTTTRESDPQPRQGLRIAVADDEQDMRDYFRKCLTRLGHTVVAVARDGRELVEQCRAVRPDLVITDIKMPDMDGIDAAAQIYQERPVPIILVSAYHDATLIERAESDHILGYLVKPIKQSDLEPVIGLTLRRFAELEALRQETSGLRQALADSQVIERARHIVMKRGPLDEQEAYRRLEQMAVEQNRPLVEIARMILASEEVKPSE
jgi:response regulator NasT